MGMGMNWAPRETVRVLPLKFSEHRESQLRVALWVGIS